MRACTPAFTTHEWLESGPPARAPAASTCARAHARGLIDRCLVVRVNKDEQLNFHAPGSMQAAVLLGRWQKVFMSVQAWSVDAAAADFEGGFGGCYSLALLDVEHWLGGLPDLHVTTHSVFKGSQRWH